MVYIYPVRFIPRSLPASSTCRSSRITSRATRTTSSAVISFDLEETVASPTLAVMRVSNRSADPGNANAASSKGPFTGVLTDFMPVKVRDGDSQRVMFYGIVYSVKEVYDNSYGMVIEVQCRDYLIELRDNTTDGAYGYNIDTTVANNSSLTNATARDDEKKLWNVGVSPKSIGNFPRIVARKVGSNKN